MQGSDYGIFTRCKFVQSWIFQHKVALAHGAFHFHDAVAHQAAEAGLGFRSIFDLVDGGIEFAAEEQRGVVTSRTPFTGLHARDVLHIFDALAIPLIVEGRKMMRGAFPLLINIRMASFTSL